MTALTKSGKYFTISLAIVAALCLVRIFQGDNASIRIHDNLDGIVGEIGIVMRNGPLDPSRPVMQIMNGNVTNGSVANRFFAGNWLYAMLQPVYAYTLNEFAVRIIGLIGAWYLLGRFFKGDALLRSIISLSWALAPFYTAYGLSVAGLPILLHCLIAIVQKGNRARDWIFVLVYPLWSYLILSGVFVIALGAVMSILLLFRKDWMKAGRLVLAIAVLTIAYAITNIDLLRGFVSPAFVSHRVEMSSGITSPRRALTDAFLMFFRGQYHVMAGQEALSIGAIILLVLAPIRRRETFHDAGYQIAFALLALVAGFSLLSGAYDTAVMMPLKNTFPILFRFQFDRFYFLSPLLLFTAFAMLVRVIGARVDGGGKWVKFLILMLGCAQLVCIVARNDEMMAPITNLLRARTGRPPTAIAFREFTSRPLFERIHTDIGLPHEQYRIVSLGVYPAIAQLNGFYTLDSYQSDYPLAYKHAFRAVIAEELARSPHWKSYFDTWGNRCYIFASGLERTVYMKVGAPRLPSLQLNVAALREIWGGPTYLVSAVEIVDTTTSGLRYRGAFEQDDMPWSLRLYEIP